MTESRSIRELTERLHGLAIHLLRRARQSDPEAGVAPAQLSALSVLVHKGALTLGNLARIEQVSPPSMSRTVAELERSGLVRRARDKRDRRIVYALATREGARLLKQARDRRLDLLSRDFGDLSDEDRDCLERACQMLEKRLR